MEMCASKSIPHTLKFAIFHTKDDDPWHPWQYKIIIFYRKAIHKGESPPPRWGSQKPTSHMTRCRSWPVHLERSIVRYIPYGKRTFTVCELENHHLQNGKSTSLMCHGFQFASCNKLPGRVSFASGIHQPNRGQVVGTESIESMDLTDKSADQSSISWECSAHSKASYCVKSIPVIYEPWLIVIIRVTPPSKKQAN